MNDINEAREVESTVAAERTAYLAVLVRRVVRLPGVSTDVRGRIDATSVVPVHEARRSPRSTP